MTRIELDREILRLRALRRESTDTGLRLSEYTNGSSVFEGQKNLSGTPARLHWAAILYEACKSQVPELIP